MSTILFCYFLLFCAIKRTNVEGKRGTKLILEREPLLRFQFCKRCCSLLDAGKNPKPTLRLDHRTFKPYNKLIVMLGEVLGVS